MMRLAFGIIAGIGLAYYRLFGGPMEGTKWEINLKADSFFAFSHVDTLIFDRGKLMAEGYQANGFGPGSYSASPVGGDVDAIWNASLIDAKKGTLTWHGLVRGDTMEGVAVLIGKDGRERRFSFTGKRA